MLLGVRPCNLVDGFQYWHLADTRLILDRAQVILAVLWLCLVSQHFPGVTIP